MYVMDPTMTSEGADAMREKHHVNAKRVLYGLIRCIHQNMIDWDISASGWAYGYNSSAHQSCIREQSGIYVLSYIRSFNGLYLEDVLDNDRLEYLHKRMAYQIMHIAGNAGDLPDFMVQIVI
uniref:Uncharacterized protein n=1 Tax=Avena sativa TaxID=4498 RepID=A0ACD5ZAN9_AVESA